MLYPSIGSNRFCGPAAIACFTGLTTDEAAAHLRILSGKRAIKCIEPQYVRAVLNQYGWSWPMALPRRRRLSDWLVVWNLGYYLIIVGNHYVTVWKGGGGTVVCDNNLVYPIQADKSWQLRRFVKQAWKIEIWDAGPARRKSTNGKRLSTVECG